ncbi:hypothetical protein OSG_eHP30_00250 [environmental Halophage eHP-30]|nr:hypothetical protein OSG_eHP30_00250 [environmental Halophage eHP-30]
MSNDIQRLYDRKRELLAQETELKNKFERKEIGGSDLESEFNSIEEELKGVENSIRIGERQEQAEKQSAKEAEQQTENRSSSKIYNDEVFPKLMSKGLDFSKLSEQERNVFDNVHSRADLGTSSSGGGVLVPTDTVREIIRAQEFMGGVRPTASVMETQDGRKMSFPFTDNTSDSGEQISENPAADTAQLNPSFSEKELDSFTFSSKEFVVSRELLQDNVFDLVAEFQRFAARRFFNVLNPLFTTGTGSSEPEGIVTGSGVTATAQNTASLVREDFINLIHKLDRAYRNNGAFQFTDEIVSSIRKLEVGSSDSRPLYQPSANANEPDRVEGYPFFVNNDLASLATTNKVATFGDHSQYRIRDVQDAEMMRLDELHALRNQVGFVMFSRHDGKLLDPNAVAVLQMP